MSGQSTTFTFVCDSERRVSVLAGLPNNDLSAIDDLSEDNMLYGSSRNNAMEWSLNHLIRKCGLPGLQHLQKGFDPATGATVDGGWWPTWLAPDELPRTVAALDALLERARTEPAQMLAALGDQGYGCEPDDLRALAIATPASRADAAAAYRKARQGNDGDDVHSLIAFVHAHRAMLDLARMRGNGAMYLAFLY